ncbi:MAG: helix-turn-helix transcriptional regulator [Actinomycetota bacterium]
MKDRDIAKLYGRRMRAQRKRLGLSVADLAASCGVTRAAVYQWEDGHACPRPAQQLRIAKALEISWSLLFGLDQLEVGA